MNKIPSVVEYVVFDPNSIPPEIKKSEDLKRFILIKTQGRSVELLETPKIALTMFIFNILHSVCPEVVLSTNNGQKFIIYDHQVDPIIHPVGVSEAISAKRCFNMTNVYTEEEVIDLEKIWNASYKNTLEEKFHESLDKARNKILRTDTTTLIGNAPLLFILAVQHLVGNNTKQLFYQKSANVPPKRVK
jgi:hypothetical protein